MAIDNPVGQNRHQKRLTMKELTTVNATKNNTLGKRKDVPKE
jgi:hypothetical protein